MVNPLDTAEIGSTGLQVTRLGFGSAFLGGNFVDVTPATAVATVRRGLERGIRLFDTAPLYGTGKSERFVGQGLSGAPRESFVLSTKVGRLLRPVASPPGSEQLVDRPPHQPVFDFSRDGVMRSLEESLERLGLDRIDIALIHDPDGGLSVEDSFDGPTHYAQVIDEAFPTLAELRSQGVVKAIGAGMNQWQMLARFAQDADPDCFLLAGRYTLLDHSGLAELLPMCESKGISVIIGGPYNSGILASDLSPGATYFYNRAPADVLERARRMKAVCDRHGVPLKAAALQFCLSHPAVAAAIPGPKAPSEVDDNLAMASHPIPAGVWDELRAEGLIPDDAPTP